MSSDNITGKPVKSSAGRFMGVNTIYDREGSGNPYMTRIWFGRLRLHIFYRGDQDEDCHDHPWDFWTFPFTSYVEEVAVPFVVQDYADQADREGFSIGPTPIQWFKRRQIVRAWRLSFRPATHCHRVLAAWDGHYYPAPDETNEDAPMLLPGVDESKRIVTLVWRGKPGRSWGFLKNRDGKWCWVAWRDYVFAGGKDGPCQ